MAVEHLAGDLDVDGIDVVEQAGGEEAADLEDEPGEEEDGDGTDAPTAGRCCGGCGGLRDRRNLLGWDGEGFYGLGEAVVHGSRYGRGGLGAGLSRGRSVYSTLPEVSSRRILLLPRRRSTSSRFSRGTNSILRSPVPHVFKRSSWVRNMWGASGKVEPKSMEEERPSTR